MVTSFADMIGRYAQAGTVQWIGLRPARKADVVSVADADVRSDGLVGDHGRAGKRAITLFQAEHLEVIGAFLGRGPVSPGDLRRNVVIQGINLSSLKRREVRIGSAIIFVEGPCAPCSRMEAAFGPGGYAAVRGHGGWYASIVEEGSFALGDAVAPPETE